ncbi:MAG: hypothetical protein HOO91_15910 [Bacteroidales bacterium]|nr:hypothetical protein [Bacteroidales bacterium]
MDTEVFREKVKKELRKLDREDVLHFAWRCAVRALPFLGVEGNFDFWEKKDRQKYLYSIFHALDANINASAAAEDAASAAAAASASSCASASVSSASSYAYAYAYNADYAYVAYAARAATYAYAAADALEIDLKDIILEDIELIRSKRGEGGMSIAVYGTLWVNFQNALETEGCGYWLKLYSNIFSNGIEAAREGVEERINVPTEILKKGAAEVGRYLEQLEKGAERLNEARIIVLGEKGAGKTCLARRLINPNAPMATDNESTAGVDKTIWRLEKENINVHIWDFAGHTVTHAVHQFFLSERCLYIIVYDGRTEERNRLEYWLDHMKNFGGNSKAIILVNKRDQHQVDIPINRLKEQYSIEGLYTFSIQDDMDELRKFREIVTDYIRNNPSWDKQLIPSNYYRVKKELEERFIKGDHKKCEEHITKEEFCRIAERNGIDNVDGLLNDLDALGISLWYKDMGEFNTLVLNPEWISNGVYKIVNWVSNERKHQLSIDEFSKVFENEVDSIRYPKEKYEFFFRLMERYELAYKISKGRCLIIPHLLGEDRPVNLPVFSIGESLMLRYKAEQPLPPNTISRFIVRHNQEIKKVGSKYIVWRYGVVLEDGKGSTALVREEDRTISVSVTGKIKTEYLSILRETLNDIFNSYKSNKPELQYRVERFGQIPDEIEKRNPLWLPDTKILSHLRNNVPYFEDVTGQHINLNYTVNNYNITAQTLLNGTGNLFTDQSVHNTFNFHNCNIGLQGNLNELAQMLLEKGADEESSQLKNLSKALKESKNCKNEDEVKETGIANRLKRFVQDLGDEESKLHKSISGVKQGVSIAQDIAKGYNDIAQWLGLPQVPKPFLKKEDKG